ncbi:right-handed parallel beta-helix repeat-containing protein [Sphingomonas sp. TREG-RG-20F-R18-01]|uniref:right-handed parallel beta-helix repeat-containing protein n=1 Tax=Sphingomonas sp. TREG-RG-20F-R18-01 TaxID=2914982 RepID=UPI001F5A4C17|nr:right-handed parallel beta-helix repeat-containing protein [Sphingomonas sp. TREG-RG-20F-R18-01]
MTTAYEIQKSVEQIVVDGGLLHNVVQGGADTVVQTEGGSVKSLAGLQRDFNVQAGDILDVSKVNAGIAAAASLSASAAKDLATLKAAIAQVAASDAGAYLAAIQSLTSGSPTTAQLTLQATSRTVLAGFTGTVAGRQAYLSEFPRYGMFFWSTANLSTNVTADPQQGIYVPPASDRSGASGAWVRLDVSTPRLEWWGGGAGGDDTDAAAAIGDYITRLGGGFIELAPGKTYNVGRQSLANDNQYMFKPARLFEIVGCTKPVVIRANGARIRFNDGLYFGTFNADGTPAGFNAAGKASTPCITAIFAITSCTGSITVEGGLEMDGNVANMHIGGGAGDTGWQLGGDGIYFSGNTGQIKIDNLRAHHFPRDGMQGSTPCLNDAAPFGNVLFINCSFHNNVRNNFSALGGRGWFFLNCSFREAAVNTPIGSAPGSGIDLEAEQSNIRNFIFDNCEFVNNSSCGMVADSGDTKDVQFRNCRFVGVSGPSCWPRKPKMKFFNCTFVGSIIVVYPSVDPDLATQFSDCYFTDDAKESPTGAVVDGYLVNGGGGNQNVLFDQCRFKATKNPAVYLSGGGGNGAIWRNSKAVQDPSLPISILSVNLDGEYNSFDGGVSAPGITYTGRILINGVDQMLYSQAFNPTSIAPGSVAYAYISAFAKPAAVGWKVSATFDQSLLGLIMTCYISAADTITVSFFNPTPTAVDLPAGTIAARIQPNI